MTGRAYMYPLWQKYELDIDEMHIERMINSAYWKRYWDGSSYDPYLEIYEDAQRYCKLVEFCHHAVADYWEEHGKMPYFETAKLVASKWMDEACSILDKWGLLAKQGELNVDKG